MKDTLKVAALAVTTALLASCGGGNASLPSTSSSNPGNATQSQSVPRSEIGSDGHVMTYFYNVNTERSGLVNSGNGSTGGRTPMSMITGLMTYHNGPVQTAPKLYMIFWGSTSQWSSTNDTAGEAAYYSKFVNAIGGSTWLSTVTQYTQSGGGSVGNGGNIVGGTWYDTTDAIPSRGLNSRSYQSYFATEAQHAAAHFGDYSASASYVILVPRGVSVYQFAGNYSGLNGYCAWHSSTSSTGGTIGYTNFPYIPTAGASCGAASVTTSNLDGVSIVGGHEQAETETDPQPNTGWLDSSNNEIGDKCAWYNLADTSFGTAGSFPTQPLWSNSANNCVQ